MKLKQGIRIHNQLKDGYDSIRMNSGTVLHDKQVAELVAYNGYSFVPQYEEFAYLPKRDWRELLPAEIDLLQANGERKDYDTVYVGEIPDKLKENFSKLGIDDAKSKDEVLDRFSQDPKATEVLSSNLKDFLSPMSNGKAFYFHCLGTNLPNIEVVGCNTTMLPKGFKPKDVKYMGLHNDGTKEMTVYTAHKFGNRISINLGKEPRSFLFINLSMVQAINMLKKKIDVNRENVNIANIPTFFFKYFPDYPVIRIKQKPYQYYIAPTDNCFHDGSTLGNTVLDVALVYFGAFSY